MISHILQLRKIQDKDELRYRLGKHTRDEQPDWNPWTYAPFTVIKRHTNHPKATPGSYLEADAVLCITPRNCPIEFSERNFCGCKDNIITLDAEEYIIQIELPVK